MGYYIFEWVTFVFPFFFSFLCFLAFAQYARERKEFVFLFMAIGLYYGLLELSERTGWKSCCSLVIDRGEEGVVVILFLCSIALISFPFFIHFFFPFFPPSVSCIKQGAAQMS